jgi:hypothetical protein
MALKTCCQRSGPRQPAAVPDLPEQSAPPAPPSHVPVMPSEPRKNAEKPLRYLVVGLAKTGTTVISKTIQNSAGIQNYYLEPRASIFREPGRTDGRWRRRSCSITGTRDAGC